MRTAVFVYGITTTLWLAACTQPEQRSQISKTTQTERIIDIDSSVTRYTRPQNFQKNWGDFSNSHSGSSYGLNILLSGFADVKPGEQMRPVHRHEGETLVIVTAGNGLWHLNGKEFPAKTGDVLYVAPWDYHTISAATDSELQFYMITLNADGIKKMPEPNTHKKTSQ